MPDATPQNDAVPERPMQGRPLRGYRWKAEDKDFNAERIARLEAEVERLEREKASIALDRDSWKHKSETDNAYLLAEVERLREQRDRWRDEAERLTTLLHKESVDA